MTLTHTYNGAALGFDVPPTKVSIPSRAEVGSVSAGGISPEDPTAALTLVGWRPYVVEETACSQPRLFTGWVAPRNIGRSFEQGQFVGADARIHDATILDLNAAFNLRIISGSDGKRPQESVDARIAWLLASNYLAGTSGTLVANTGKVATGFSLLMDEADYRGSFAADVLADCAGRYATPINWFAFWDPATLSAGLFWDYVSAATWDCTISISNLVADTYVGDTPSTTCFAPVTESRLERSPDTVFSDVIVDYANGSVHRTMAATATAFIRRGTRISRPYIGSAATAELAGNAFLACHNVETDRITTTIRVPRETVGLIQAGMRMNVKFSHMPGYAAFTSMRIVSCDPRAVDDTARFYDVGLELVSPRVPPTAALYAELQWHHGGLYACSTPEPSYADGAAIAGWENTGDAPHGGFSVHPTVGAVEYVAYPVAGTACKWLGIRMLADGTVDVESVGGFGGVAGSPAASIKVDLRHNGTIITTQTVVDPAPGGAHSFQGSVTLAVTGVAVKAEDTFTVSFTFYNWIGFQYYAAIAGELFAATHLTVTGTGSWPGTVAGVELPKAGGTTTATRDPTITDDAAAGYSVGDTWVNTASGEAFVLLDATAGAAVWLSITARGPGASRAFAYFLGG